jgi:hypothetical protein
MPKLTYMEESLLMHLRTHTGRKFAVTSRKLKQRGYGGGAAVRAMVHNLRVAGYPICSCNEGYYYAETEEELRGSMVFLDSYIKHITEARNGLSKALMRW